MIAPKQDQTLKPWWHKASIVACPTFRIAEYFKAKYENRHEWIINRLNWTYFGVSLGLWAALCLLDLLVPCVGKTALAICLGVVAYYCWSRATEVFYAFLKDTFDKIDSIKPNRIPFPIRIRLALRSYLELVFVYSIIYRFFAVLDSGAFKTIDGLSPRLWDLAYFSSVTMVTLGYGDISPLNWPSRVFSVYQVANGLILLVVTFAVYVSLAVSERESNGRDRCD